jgi:predicted component of type VI protein secretion system
MTTELARPIWRKGQVLQPEHFRTLEAALSAESAFRTSLLGLPLHGLSRLLWNGDQPKGGVVTVWELVAVLPDGTLIDVPWNATFVESSLSLKVAGSRLVELFAHVLPSNEQKGEPALTPDAPNAIPRAYHELVLSSEPQHPTGGARILLGRFTQGSKGEFQLCEDYIPPLTNLAETPVLATHLRGTTQHLKDIRCALEEQVLVALARGDSGAMATRVWVEARKLEALLGDALTDVPAHPYPVFVALRNFVVELGMLGSSLPEAVLPRYQHENLAACFLPLIGKIASYVMTPVRDEPIVEFTPGQGRLTATLPDEALDATEFWVGVLKQRTSDSVSLDQTVVASPGRLRLVCERSLRAMTLVRDLHSPLRERLSGPIETYRIEGAGTHGIGERREWNAALQERALAFNAPQEIRAMKIVLYWRRA